MRALKSGPCLRRGPNLRVSPQRRLSRRAVLRRVRLRPATRPRLHHHPTHRASREVLIAEAEATIQIAAAAETTQIVAVDEMIQAAAGMIPIGVIGTPALVEVVIPAVAQSIQRAAEFAVVTAMAAAIGATER